MSFPTEFPQQAVAVVISKVRGEEKSNAQLALAAYELVGYGLYHFFGDAKYMVGVNLSQLDLAKLMEVLKSPEFLENLEAFKDAGLMFLQGVPVWRIALRISIKYGPKVVLQLKRLIEAIRA